MNLLSSEEKKEALEFLLEPFLMREVVWFSQAIGFTHKHFEVKWRLEETDCPAVTYLVTLNRRDDLFSSTAKLLMKYPEVTDYFLVELKSQLEYLFLKGDIEE